MIVPIRNNPDYFKSYTLYVDDAVIKIDPVVSTGNTNWHIRIFRSEHQGPIWFGEELTEEVLFNHSLELPGEKVEEINEARQWAEDFLEFSTDFNREKREEAPLSELSKMTDMGQVWKSYNPI